MPRTDKIFFNIWFYELHSPLLAFELTVTNKSIFFPGHIITSDVYPAYKSTFIF